MFCKNCGKEIPDESKYCTFCGSPVNPEATQKPSSSSSNDVDVVSILAIVFSFLVPPLGCLIGAIGLSNKNKSGHSLCLASTIVGGILSLAIAAFLIVWLVFFFEWSTNYFSPFIS
ncbi:MAG: zinc ribbon domain-containing protein [Bacilli bacterium]|jgi:hypothetical protein|nr:zinc ribbon domain-containing protein [Bacilli bacterium]MCH4210743.1 zinc ribbon domain-containing protein [Bacilli bacterium]MCH4228524.1 zinc ribbon domain-containing protein [Bacilli bacterium]MCH4277806.1 zinc ribbon domain-containing protein [Bacilli bacterium]MCI2054976.1 zinc ribbon domain-containing protein [Bacilli bacterium]